MLLAWRKASGWERSSGRRPTTRRDSRAQQGETDPGRSSGGEGVAPKGRSRDLNGSGESIHWISGPGLQARVPGIGYAPLESRTKQWAQEPPIEGWFPLSSGEQVGCDRPRSLVPSRERANLEPSTSLRKRPSRAAETTNVGRQDEIGRRVGEVRLDSLPHRGSSIVMVGSMRASG